MSYRLCLAEILIRWDQLEPGDLENIQPQSAELAELLQARYGFCRNRAKREAEIFLADFEERLRRALVA